MPLRLDWCGHDAAVYATGHWHYSRCMPAGRVVKIGVWDDGRFGGVILFSRGATPNIGKPYGLTQVQVCELTRVALAPHRFPVSRVLAIALRMVRRQSPGLRLIVSYADIGRGHHGGIYQATGWTYVGVADSYVYRLLGRIVHPKSVGQRYGHASVGWLRRNVDPAASRVNGQAKHKYLMPLDDEMRRLIEPLRKPYPKRVGSSEVEHRATSPEDGGSNPTPTLERHSDAPKSQAQA